MDVEFLGGAREIGRSAILVDDSLLLDFGMDSGNPPTFPIDDVDPDAVVVSHGHLDHVGSVPSLLSGDARPSIHWTPPTDELTRVLARDTLRLHGGTYDCPFTETEVARLAQVSETHDYREPFEAAGYEITFFDAGHVPGSAHVLVSDGGTRVLYTGDFHTEQQRLLSGTTARPDADIVICESTYSDVDRPPREEIESEFVESVEETIWGGGTVVVPAFAIGRTQEVLCLCEEHDLECYVDGMGKRVTEIFLQAGNRDFLRDPDLLRRAKGNARFVGGRDGQRERIAEQNTVIVTTSGMLHGGPAMTYVPAIRSHPANKIAMTGYQVEGTPGRELLETGSAVIDGRSMRVSAQVEQYDFSAHADREGVLEFLESYADSEVLVNHGDRCEAFAEELRAEGFAATAPELGERLEV
ncbi:MBL fold metallo-hydrolase [Natronobacterium gregoryi]|uniref:Exonuclease of the beta-lactamase fold involved in RNA processing n=2 Tax=Natronobacterium gregoryi TaxID=44930 RepID=L0AIY2_NATGS|nr:MBL fold metallo-hydrolase [Natronobacterium gregoryi]AFZ73102.1 putative exonuclease of the beta-lactamase fold involved in RNA processing [Natronobacterium gregoryi SP2]ELY70799.1 RNA-metabolising metallo-beta-lactamase [Natronobacterium gregoryi SP2]PLK20379.1 MBL fold metallo-hydrolase [Natronobacterium gregoryi SP2]SFI61135.1 putative mRNA 3-end processing factor [Natronobacterium gregoryi]